MCARSTGRKWSACLRWCAFSVGRGGVVRRTMRAVGPWRRRYPLSGLRRGSPSSSSSRISSVSFSGRRDDDDDDDDGLNAAPKGRSTQPARIAPKKRSRDGREPFLDVICPEWRAHVRPARQRIPYLRQPIPFPSRNPRSSLACVCLPSSAAPSFVFWPACACACPRDMPPPASAPRSCATFTRRTSITSSSTAPAC